ncbi:MAG: glutathione S-transferase family protein [Alphaproteobacteria bacterium]|nr:glutathione S-transferase family protein [Alphaproteobacteria bacterium]
MKEPPAASDNTNSKQGEAVNALTIYGAPQSRAFRTLWMAKELGLDFKNEPLSPRSGETRKPEFLAINPNGHVPAIDDGGVRLCESMAINLYLARKHDKGLWPKNVADEGRAFMWSLWAITEAEAALLPVLINRFVRPGSDAEGEAKALPKIDAMLKILDQALAGKDYLLGGSFSVADLNVASVLSWAKLLKIDLKEVPKVDAWLGRCLGRPAAKVS